MKAKTLHLQIVLFAFSIFFATSCQDATAVTYYVSNDGNDNADGTSPKTAWKTIAKVNSKNFRAGDSILFRAGDSWREIMKLSTTGTSQKWMYYGRYGKGVNPKFLGSEKADRWSQTDTKNIWKAKSTGFIKRCRING